MKRLAPLVAVLSLAVGGCLSHPSSAVNTVAGRANNSAEFDAYTSRRSADLLRMGATKNASEADFQARLEAERRYGPRTELDSVSWSRSTASQSRTLSSGEIDKALGKK
jgi:hypothetical protein